MNPLVYSWIESNRHQCPLSRPKQTIGLWLLYPESGHCVLCIVAYSIAMQIISLDGSDWQSKQDFYDALADALGCIDWHGRNADAFMDTMIYSLELQSMKPPYRVNINQVGEMLRPFLEEFAAWVKEARVDRKTDPNWGDDVEVSVNVY